MVQYEVKKSACGAISFWWILSCVLIIPIFIVVYRVFKFRSERITIYEDRIVHKKGILNVQEKTFMFIGVFSVDIESPLLGRIFNYGHLDVDFVGKDDINMRFVKNPKDLKKFLETKIVKKSDVVKSSGISNLG